jgi:ABC-2 type transport system permease protein
MNDIRTIVWKEWKDAIFPGGRIVSIGPILFLVLMGIVFPLIDRQGWLTLSTAMVLLNVFIPYYYIGVYIGDSFAGERERHTLETLLATRISDQGILWGKVVANVGYVWMMTLMASGLSLAVVNLAMGNGRWMFYSPFTGWLAILLSSLLACLLAASGGILVSLHSATVRQSQQTFLLGSLVLFVAIYLAGRAVPAQLLQGLSPSQTFLIFMLIMAILDAILLAISMASFHRSRLILN